MNELPLRGKKIAIFGGSGQIGQQLVQEIVRAGGRVRVGVRRPHLAGDLRLNGAVGDVQVVQANILDINSVGRCLENMDAAINCVGLWQETGRRRYTSVFEQGAENVAVESAKAGISHLLHFSAFGADVSAPSRFLRSKAVGENKVLGAFSPAVILRPNLVFGDDDRLFNRFANWVNIMPVFLMIAAPTAKFRPIYANDIGKIAMSILSENDSLTSRQNKIDLCGPELLSFEEIIHKLLHELDKKRVLVSLPRFVLKLQGLIQDGLIAPLPFISPLFSADEVDRLAYMAKVQEESGDTSLKLIDDLLHGSKLRQMDAIIGNYLWRFRKDGEFHVKSV